VLNAESNHHVLTAESNQHMLATYTQPAYTECRSTTACAECG